MKIRVKAQLSVMGIIETDIFFEHSSLSIAQF